MAWPSEYLVDRALFVLAAAQCYPPFEDLYILNSLNHKHCTFVPFKEKFKSTNGSIAFISKEQFKVEEGWKFVYFFIDLTKFKTDLQIVILVHYIFLLEMSHFKSPLSLLFFNFSRYILQLLVLHNKLSTVYLRTQSGIWRIRKNALKLNCRFSKNRWRSKLYRLAYARNFWSFWLKTWDNHFFLLLVQGFCICNKLLATEEKPKLGDFG